MYLFMYDLINLFVCPFAMITQWYKWFIESLSSLEAFADIAANNVKKLSFLI